MPHSTVENEEPPRAEVTHAEFEQFQERPPDRLFHYTTAEGFLGIIQENSLWATDLRYMNDFSELAYGRGLIQQAFEAAQQRTLSELEKRFMAEVRQIIATLPQLNRVFAFSLHEDENLLSQWRAYGGRGTGYSIGFESQDLRTLESRAPGQTLLVRALYDRGKQEDLVKGLFRDACREVAGNLQGKNERDIQQELKAATRSLAAKIQYYFLAFKNPSFREEKEWRLTCLISNSLDNLPHIRFRSSRGFLVPFLLLSPPEKALLPITAVVQGPRSGASVELNQEVIHHLLWKHGYKDFAVRDSGIPLRSD